MPTKFNKSRVRKDDEYYTPYEVVENEVKNYNLQGKVVYCNCDDYRWSNFVKYFRDNFDDLGIKRLIATNYDLGYEFFSEQHDSYHYEFDGKVETVQPLKGDGSYESPECLALLDECDVVITNPPFSKWRPFVATLYEHQKEFLVVGLLSAITYKNIWCRFLEKQLFYGYTTNFTMTGNKTICGLSWFTSIPVKNHKLNFNKLTKTFNEINPQKYDNFDAYEIKHLKDIPIDCYETMGVPVSYAYMHNDDEFEILGMICGDNLQGHGFLKTETKNHLKLNDKCMYARIIIKRKRGC